MSAASSPFPAAVAPLAPYMGVAVVAAITGITVMRQLSKVIHEGNGEDEARRLQTHSERRKAEASDAKGSKGILSHVSFLIRPMLTCGFIVAAAANPLSFQRCGAFPALLGDYMKTSVVKALPTLVVTTLSEAYAYGSLAQQALGTLVAGSGSASSSSLSSSMEVSPSAIADAVSRFAGASPDVRRQIEGILAKASDLAGGGRTVALGELLEVHRLILAQDAHQSITSRILGVFTLTNIVYLVSIIGMTAVFGPFCFQLAKQFGLLNLANAALEAAKRFCRKVVVPLYMKSRPLTETAFYYASLYAFVESTRYVAVNDRFGMGGVFSAVSSLCIFALSWLYSLMIRSEKPPTKAVRNFINATTLAFATIMAGAGAITHGSTLLGYFAVATFLANMGLFAVSTPLYIVIGFSDEEQLLNVAQASLTLVVCYVLQRIGGGGAASGDAQRFLKPFESAVSVLGATGYMLAVDILVGIRWRRPAAHALFILSAMGFISAGTILGLPGLANTALVFGFLYLYTLYGTMCLPRSSDTIVLWLMGLFVSMYFASRWLSNNPSLLVNALTMGVGSNQ